MNLELRLQKFTVPMINDSILTSQLVYGNEKSKISPNAPVTTDTYIKNKHLGNPVKESLVIQLVQKEQIRGHIFLIERCFIFHGLQKPVLVASDLVSKVDIPGAGILIYRKALQYCKENNVPLLNFSNNKSDQIYSQIMKMKPTVELDFQLGFFNYKSLLLNLIRNKKSETNEQKVYLESDPCLHYKNLSFQVVSEFTESIDEFLETLEKKHFCLGRRDSKILNWRFNSANQLNYLRILIIKEEKIVGYLVVCERLIKGKNLLVIIDFVILVLNSVEIRNLQKVLKKLYPNALACLWISNSHHTQKDLTKFKGLFVPKKFSPERVKFYLSTADESFKSSLKNAHLTLFDTDIL
jgi:hypothetical protein